MTQPPPSLRSNIMEDMPSAMPMMGEEVETDDVFSFTPPKNFTPPDDYEEGKPFDVVTSMVMQNGKLAIKALNGTPIEQTEEEPEETEVETETETSAGPMPEDGGASLAQGLAGLGL